MVTPATVHGPSRLTFGSRVAYVWLVELEGIPHKIAWLPRDGGGALRLARRFGDAWSPFIPLGAAYSPQQTMQEARAAVQAWADRQTTRREQGQATPTRHEQGRATPTRRDRRRSGRRRQTNPAGPRLEEMP